MVSLSDRPDLRHSVRWLTARGELARLLPGVYAAVGSEDDPHLRIAAVMARHPDAVLCGAAAAFLTFWPRIDLPVIEVAHPKEIAPQPGYLFSQRRIPPELIVESRGLRFSDPALTAIDLATPACADAIDIALRTRATTLPAMHEALRLTPDRAGNRDRRSVLLDSRDEPWSGAERQAHRLLRAARIVGWRTNAPRMVRGRLYYLDICFEGVRLVIEIDGRIHQLDAELFESDRRRQNALVLDGWRVLRFTWRQIQDMPEIVVAEIREALASGRAPRA